MFKRNGVWLFFPLIFIIKSVEDFLTSHFFPNIEIEIITRSLTMRRNQQPVKGNLISPNNKSITTNYNQLVKAA